MVPLRPRLSETHLVLYSLKAKKFLRGSFHILFRPVVSLGLIILLLRSVDKQLLLNTFLTAKPPYLLAAFLLSFLNMLVGVFRWKLLLAPFKLTTGFLPLCRISFVGLFFNIFVPGGIAGELVRGYQLSASDDADPSHSYASVFTDRLMGLVGFIAISLGGLLFTSRMMQQSGLFLILMGVCITCLAGLTVFYNRSLMRWLGGRLPDWGNWRNRLQAFYRDLLIYRSHGWVVMGAFCVTLVCHLLMIASIYLLSLSISAKTPFFYFLLFVPVIGILTALPMSIGGLGLREAGYVLLFSSVGMSSVQALNTSILFWGITLILGAIGGIVFLCGRRLDSRDEVSRSVENKREGTIG